MVIKNFFEILSIVNSFGKKSLIMITSKLCIEEQIVRMLNFKIEDH